MRFEILTLFPETFEGFLKTSLIGKAAEKDLIQAHLHNIRDHAPNRRQADDRPYGGGPGMVLMAEPIYRTLKFVKKNCLNPAGKKTVPSKKIGSFILSPKGKPFTSSLAKEYAGKYRALVLLAGHYEGMDQRVARFFDGELSIGPFITMGGEAPAMAVMEAVSRFVPGVVGDPRSLEEESFSITNTGLLEWPAYTRPEIWRGKKVPRVLLSGHHAKIRAWRLNKAIPPVI